MTALVDSSPDPWQAQRERMVREDIASSASDGRMPVKNLAVLKAMLGVPRHLFVPASWQDRAYEDSPLLIGHGQTISQPYIVGLMTELLNPKKDDVVLEIGTGSGYQAAILAETVRHVYTMEIIPELGETATRRLRDLHYTNITVRVGDGYQGWKEHAPYDGILVTAAPNTIPSALIEQLKPGARMVLPVGSIYQIQMLTIITKEKDGSIRKENVIPVSFVPMVHKP